MKVLHLVKTSTGGLWAFRVMRDLVDMGVEVHVAMPVDGSLVQKYKDAGIIVHDLTYSLRSPLKTVIAIRKVVNNIKPEVIHSHFVLTTMLMRMALPNSKIPRVFEVPGPLHLEHFVFRNADILTARKKVDNWLPTCKWSYNKYLECGIDRERLCLTYYGGDLVSEQYQKGKLRAGLGLSDNDIIVGMVAYMYAPKKYLGEKRGLKGHEDLADAVALIQDKYPNLHLVYIGGAWAGAVDYEKEVISYCSNKVRNVHFLGTRSDVPELYQDFDVAVHPSHSENLGGAGESLYFAIPTIATEVGGFPDIVIPERTGYLVPSKNPRAIADAIEHVLLNPSEAKSYAESGRRMIIDLFESKKTTLAVYDFYKTIVKTTD